MTEEQLPAEVEAALQRLDELVRKLEEHPEPAVQDHMIELLRCVDTVHRSGLQRLNDLLKKAGLQRRATEDPEVRLLFDLYDLGEGGDAQRAEALLDVVRPSIEAQGGRLELIDLQPGLMRVRLVGSFETAGGPAAARRFVEHTLRNAWPDLPNLELEAAEQPPENFVPLSSLRLARRPPLEWRTVAALSDLPRGTTLALDFAGGSVLLVRDVDDVYAYRNACPNTPFPLDAARIEGCVLVCPWHGCRFDVRGGRRLDLPDRPGLGVVPVRVEHDEILVGTPQGAAA